MKLTDKIFEQHMIVLGKTGAGKSSALRHMIEGRLDLDVPVCIIDPKGDWWGLKSSASGNQKGYAVIIFGGEHADVPLNAHAGAHVAQLVATGNRPCIIDLGGWMVGERTRFFIDFASSLFRSTRGRRIIVIDECHNFAPQGKILDPDAGKMLHWANRLASEGRGKGLTIMAASQRPQKVHKDFLTCAETLFAMRVIHPLDRRAVEEWIDGCEDRAKGREVLQTLASMQRGEAWAWSPEIGYGPDRVRFPMFKTFDSFAASANAGNMQLKGWATVDLEEVKAKLASVVEEAKSNDSKELRKQIADLKRQLTDSAKAPPAQIETREIPVVSEKDLARVDKAVARIEAMTASALERIEKTAKDHGTAIVDGVLEPVRALHARLKEIKGAGRNEREIMRYYTQPPKRQAVAANVAKPTTARHSAGNIPAPQQRIINALAWWQDFSVYTPSREQVAFVARFSPSGGHYTNTLGAMRTAGLIEYPGDGLLKLTGGSQYAAPPDSLPTFEALCERVRSILKGPQEKIFNVLVESGEISREELGELAGFTAGGGHFTNTLGCMRTLRVIDYPSSGRVALSQLIEGFRGE